MSSLATHSEGNQSSTLDIERILNLRNEAFDEMALDDVVIYAAHVQENRAARSIAQQLGRSIKSIERTIDYVESALRAKLEPHLRNYIEEET